MPDVYKRQGEGGLIIVYLIAVVVIRELHSAVGIMRRGIDEGIFKLRLREENVCQRRAGSRECRRKSLRCVGRGTAGCDEQCSTCRKRQKEGGHEQKYADLQQRHPYIDVYKRQGYEFRTTVVAPLHDEESMLGIGRLIKGAGRYFLQGFADSGALIAPEGLRAVQMCIRDSLRVHRRDHGCYEGHACSEVQRGSPRSCRGQTGHPCS